MIGFGVLLMSCMDAMFTLRLLSLGGQELNLAMKVLIESDTLSFLITKYLLTAFGVVLLIALSGVRLAGILSARRVLQGVFVMYGCLMIYEVFLLVSIASDNLV